MQKQNQKQPFYQIIPQLSETIYKMSPIERVSFLSGYLCSYAKLGFNCRRVHKVKNLLEGLQEAMDTQFITFNNFIEIFVDTLNYTQILSENGIGEQKLMEKIEYHIQDNQSELACNPAFLKNKWSKEESMQKQTNSYIKKNQFSHINGSKPNKFLEQQSIKLIIQLQEQENRMINQDRERKKKESQKVSCVICQQEIPFQEMGTIDCGHIFHKACLRGHIEANVQSKKLNIKCPADCGAKMIRDDIYEFIDGLLKEKYDKFSFDDYVQNYGGNMVSWCPTAGCTAVFCHEGDLSNYRCPVCHKHYCLSCRCDFHLGQTCAQYRINNSYGQNDRKFQQFVQGAKFKQCPKCKFWVQRNQGCNSMTCRCGNQFCYDCGGSDCPHGKCKNRK